MSLVSRSRRSVARRPTFRSKQLCTHGDGTRVVRNAMAAKVQSPREWWFWPMDTPPSGVSHEVATIDMDYRSRVFSTFRGGPEYQKMRTIATSLGSPGRPTTTHVGAMLMFRWQHPTYSHASMWLSPPLFHFATIMKDDEHPTWEHPLFIQPWLYETGRGGIFYTDGDHPTLPQGFGVSFFEYGKHICSPTSETHATVLVAADSFLERGVADPRFL